MKNKIDIVELAQVFSNNFQGVNLSDITVLIHDMIDSEQGYKQTTYKRYLTPEQYQNAVSKIYSYIQSLNVQQFPVSYDLAQTRLKAITN